MSAAQPANSPTGLFKERIRRVFREFPGALAGNEEPVHQLRVAGRRLRVALPLLAGKPRGRRLRKADRILRDLTRAAGAGRDLDVLVALFDSRLAGLAEVSAEQRELRRRMKKARARSRRRLAEGMLDLDIDGLRRHLRRIRSRGTAEPDSVLARTRAVSQEEGTRVLTGLAAVGDRYDPEALHALRRRIRRLRYTAEVEEALTDGEARASAMWKKLQDAIGSLHDAHVLAEWLGSEAERAAARSQPELAKAARAERQAMEGEARRLHRQLLEAGPAGLVEKAIRRRADGGSGRGSPRKRQAAVTPRRPVARSPYRAAPPPSTP